jgi:hypothetical protein
VVEWRRRSVVARQPDEVQRVGEALCVAAAWRRDADGGAVVEERAREDAARNERCVGEPARQDAAGRRCLETFLEHIW